jgi:hypothetical protein
MKLNVGQRYFFGIGYLAVLWATLLPPSLNGGFAAFWNARPGSIDLASLVVHWALIVLATTLLVTLAGRLTASNTER